MRFLTVDHVDSFSGVAGIMSLGLTKRPFALPEAAH